MVVKTFFTDMLHDGCALFGVKPFKSKHVAKVPKPCWVFFVLIAEHHVTIVISLPHGRSVSKVFFTKLLFHLSIVHTFSQ
jgi:hypothetical protein